MYHNIMPVSAGIRAAILRQAASGVPWRGFGIRNVGVGVVRGGGIVGSQLALNGASATTVGTFHR